MDLKRQQQNPSSKKGLRAPTDVGSVKMDAATQTCIAWDTYHLTCKQCNNNNSNNNNSNNDHAVLTGHCSQARVNLSAQYKQLMTKPRLHACQQTEP